MRRAILLFLVGLFLPLAASAQGARFDVGACNPRSCDESGWIYDDNTADHATTWRHDLGVTPRSISILFSPDPSKQSVMPVIWSWHDSNAGNPINVQMDRRLVRLNIHRNAPLHGLWNVETQQWQHFKEGYWKIIVYR